MMCVIIVGTVDCGCILSWFPGSRLLRPWFGHWAMRRRGYSVILVRNSQALATPLVSATSTGTVST
jgi:hypothetical protein